MATFRDALEPETVLNGYKIETIVGGGGFGVVYRARHILLGECVAIKEYFPLELAVRRGNRVYPHSGSEALFTEGLQRFVYEGRVLVRFRDDPVIVSCRDLFKSSGTAYLVMEFEDAPPLSELLRSRESHGQPLSEKELLDLMIPLTEGLERVHASAVFHRDIKPSNILVRKSGGGPVLIDFGAAKQNVAIQTKSLAPFTPGYAAPEQVGEGSIGPWTDVYGLGAVMWRIVACAVSRKSLQPGRAEARAYADLQGKEDPLVKAHLLGEGRFSPRVLDMIENCLELNENERIRDTSELLELLRDAKRNKFVPEATTDSPLHNAARANEPRAIEVLCRAGCEPSAANDQGQTALHIASQADNPEAIKALLEANADIVAYDRSGDTPLHTAALNGAIRSIEVLAAAGAAVDDTNNDRYTALHLAAREGQVTAITALLAAGADVLAGEGERGTPLHLAAEVGQATSITALVEAGARGDALDEDWHTPLHLAARGGHASAIKPLVEWGKPDFGDSEETLLNLAVQSGHLAAVEALLETGFGTHCGFGLEGPTPLHWAARRGDVAMIKVLLGAGADVCIQDEQGETPLHWAASAGQAEAINELVAAGAFVGAKNRDDMATPMHLAARARQVIAVEALLAAGANVLAITMDGETPLDWVQPGDERTRQSLVAAGAEYGSTWRVDPDDPLVPHSSLQHMLGRMAPRVSGVWITSRPWDWVTYGAGEMIQVRVDFDTTIEVTGSPQLALNLHGATRYASTRLSCIDESPHFSSLYFRYGVGVEDAAPDGINIASDALTLNGGSIRSVHGAQAVVDLGTHAIQHEARHGVDGSVATSTRARLRPFGRNAAKHGVDGSVATAPRVSWVHIINQPLRGTVYGAGETITVSVGFNMLIDVTGSPQLALNLDGATGYASFALRHFRESASSSLWFNYQVGVEDTAPDGIKIAAGALTLNSGSIRSIAGANAVLSLGTHAIRHDTKHKVDGNIATVPRVSGVWITSGPSNGKAYGVGEYVAARVDFDIPIEVTGSPQLALQVGACARQAGYSASRVDGSSLFFWYRVQAEDVAPEGIAVSTDALTLNGGSIRSTAATPAVLDLGSHAIRHNTKHKVCGSIAIAPKVSGVWITSGPSNGNAYGAGENIEVRVDFDIPIEVTGSEQMALQVGACARYASLSFYEDKILYFGYQVQAEDAAPEGIAVSTDALTLSGGSIQSRWPARAPAVLDLGSHAIRHDRMHKVNGSIATVPEVRRVVVDPPSNGTVFVAGENIGVRVDFDLPVEVTGSPQLALQVGACTRRARYSGRSMDCSSLIFNCRVQADDAAPDGIAISADALALNGGSIQSSAAAPAILDLGSHAIQHDPKHKVDGTMFDERHQICNEASRT